MVRLKTDPRVRDDAGYFCDLLDGLPVSLENRPELSFLLGHCINVTALGAPLDVDFIAPGYAVNDVSPGCGLWSNAFVR